MSECDGKRGFFVVNCFVGDLEGHCDVGGGICDRIE